MHVPEYTTIDMPNQDSSWQNVSDWYTKLVGEAGHHYHAQVILPFLHHHWKVSEGESVLDLGCGQGVLARFLGPKVKYVGVDAAAALIKTAQKNQTELQRYVVADVTQPIANTIEPAKKDLSIKQFDHAVCMLALQNMEQPAECIKNISEQLKPGGTALLILNHPCFRIPRQTGWDTNPATKVVYRWINKYLSFQEIPIRMHPGQKQSPITWSYHFALQDLFGWLKDARLVTTNLTELTSDKESQGKKAKAENRGRAEIPLFMVLELQKR